MSEFCYIGIDTSNYTTSASICRENGEIAANIKKLLPVKTGEKGLRQSDAVFAHVKNMPVIMEELKKIMTADNFVPKAIGYSAYPRDVEGSYMPCFLVGKAVAQSMAAISGIPTYGFSHQSGHIMAAVYSSHSGEKILNGRFAAFHVSGGTTEMLEVEPSRDYFKIRLIGGTDDLNAGQAIDRVGVKMGLSFPCGREMEMLANEYEGNFSKCRMSVKGLSCNLSGLENMAVKLYSQTGNKNETSAFVFDYIANVLSKLTENLRNDNPNLPIVYSGGVMSNMIIQKHLNKFENVYFAEPQFSSDNAAGTALLCRRKFLNNLTDK